MFVMMFMLLLIFCNVSKIVLNKHKLCILYPLHDAHSQ